MASEYPPKKGYQCGDAPHGAAEGESPKENHEEIPHRLDHGHPVEARLLALVGIDSAAIGGVNWPSQTGKGWPAFIAIYRRKLILSF